MITIGTCPCSWGVWYPKHEHQPHWQDFASEAQQAGYTVTELGPFGYLPTDLDRLQSILQAHNLTVCSTAAVASLSKPDSLDDLWQEIQQVGPILQSLGASWYVLMDESADYPTKEARNIDNDLWDHMIKTVHEIAHYVHDHYGLNFAFHPHVGTCVETEPQIIRFMNDTDEKLVHLCFDTGHHAYTGADPIAFIEKHHHRIGYYHFKNVDAKIRQKVIDENLSDDEAFELGVMCRLRNGFIDYPKVIDTIKATGFSGYCIIEQDTYPDVEKKSQSIAIDNLKFIKELGL